MALAIIENRVLSITKLALLKNTLVKFLEVVLCEAVVLKEFLDFIVNVFSE